MFFTFFLLLLAAVLCLMGTRAWHSEFQPVSWREFAAAVGGGLAFLYFVYQEWSFWTPVHAGTAVFLLLLIPLFVLGGSSRKFWKLQLLLGFMLCVSALRLFQIGSVGSELTSICAFGLVFFLAAACGETPMTYGTLSRFFFSSLWRAAPRGLQNFQFVLHVPQFNLFSRMGCAAILAPAFLVLVFGAIFANANPAILEWFQALGRFIDQIFLNFGEFLDRFLKFRFVDQLFVFLCVFCGLCGFLAPRIWSEVPQKPQFAGLEIRPEEKPVTLAHIAIYWNSLFALVLLFAVELTYEFSTLLTWNPPAGFDFGTYCHEGAFWLTMALGLATLVLAAIFRPKVCRHERVNALKRLAFLWIVENALLAVMIYIRLATYVQQTGLTSLRVIGFFGTTAVTMGIVLMALKLQKDRPAGWLLAGYTWTVVVLVWLYATLPVDWLVWKYNVAAIQTGNKAPLVHLAEQAISDEGVIPLFTLLKSKDPIIRNGVAVVILKHPPKEPPHDWRLYSCVDHRLRKLYRKPENQKILNACQKENAMKSLKMYGERHYR